MISVIIPTYKEPEVLDMCLNSCINGQSHINEIIVVVDGYYDINREVIERWAPHINILNLPMNVGLCKATNMGVYNATNDIILVVNDDNVFPREWDTILLDNFMSNTVLSPNQIEPIPSIFKQFHIKDLGRVVDDFNLDDFWQYEESIRKNLIESSGSTLPFMMHKIDYLKVGGWDESYPSHWTVDWEFFYKLQLCGLQMNRTYQCNFYHFGSVSDGEHVQNDSDIKRKKELACSEWFKYKWGGLLYNDRDTNQKFLR